MREWYTGFAHRYVAPVLSQNKVGVWLGVTPSSLSKLLIHMSSADALAKALYSASVDDRETDFYLVDFHEMMLVPRYRI